uniref:C2H2-type domain-containing protein n=1 Tax=Strongyloides papillosus TaxID=174720 RepID=A0A0N5BS58_STREA
MEIQERQLYTCHFCTFKTNDSDRHKRHEYYCHIVEILFPPSPGSSPGYCGSYICDDDSEEIEQYTECIIRGCESIIVDKCLTRHVMNRHCDDNVPFQCKYCFRFFSNHVSVLYHAIECTRGAISIYFHEEELKLLKLCVNNKKGFNIYKESFETYLNHDVKYNIWEYNEIENKSSTFPQVTVGLSLKIIQRILDSFFRCKSIQRKQLEEAFSVSDSNNFDEMYHFFHSIASLFPSVFNALVPIVQCCENRYTDPQLCTCNKINIYKLPIYDEKYEEIELQDDLPPLIRTPNNVYCYALNPNTFFINGTHQFLKIIDGIFLDTDGIYGTILLSVIYRDIFEFMKMDDSDLNSHLINYGYNNDRERRELITIIRNKSFLFMNNKNAIEGEERSLLDDTIFLPTCTFTDDSKAERLKHFIEEANSYFSSGTFNGDIKMVNNYTMPLYDNINFGVRSKNRRIEPTTSSRLAIALKNVIASYCTAPDYAIEECLKKVELSHIYFCINDDDAFCSNDTDGSSIFDCDIENSYDFNSLNHHIKSVELPFYEPDSDYEDDSMFYKRMMELSNVFNSVGDFDEYNDLIIQEDNNDFLEIFNYTMPCTPPMADVTSKDYNYIVDLTANNNITQYEPYFSDQHTTFVDNVEYLQNSLSHQSLMIYENNLNNLYQPLDLSINNINDSCNIQNLPCKTPRNFLPQEVFFQPQPICTIQNSLLNRFSILNESINFYYFSPVNVKNLHDVCLDNLNLCKFSERIENKLHDRIVKILQSKKRLSKGYKILHKAIEK